MYEINPAEWESDVGPPFQHQIDGVKFLLGKPEGMVADEPGSGKSRQIVDLSCILYKVGEIDTVVVVCPSGVKSTWKNKDEGQIALHAWQPSYIEEFWTYHTNLRKGLPRLHWIITCYEFIRNKPRLDALKLQLRGRKVLIVFDESGCITAPKAQQTKASKELRRFARRAYIMDGSPVFNSLMDLYAPFAVLNKNIIGVPSSKAYRNRYCKMGGWKNKQIVGYQNVEELQKKLAPYIIRRLKEDCLDLPPKIQSPMDVPFTEQTWKVYKELRDEMIAWLDDQTPIITRHAIVKLIRLRQLCSGIAGGIAETALLDPDLDPEEEEEKLVELFDASAGRVISSEKHKWTVDWFGDRVHEVPNFRSILWTSFRREQLILRDMLTATGKGYRIFRIYGGQNKSEREDVISEFNKPSDVPTALLGQPRAGGIGINLQAECGWAVYVSNDYSRRTRIQSEDRIHRAGQKASVVNYLDILATGPQGQKTIDHQIRKVLRAKEILATNTTAYWRTVLREE